MSKLADLHVHTNLSDGTFSPEKVVECSKTKGLDAIAITDHDCCAGIAPAIVAAKDMDIEIIPGVELTVEMEGEDELHILGYFIDWEDATFTKKLDEIVRVREERAKKILNLLKKRKVEISEKELFALSGQGCVGRLHIAHLLVRKGFVSSIAKAFKKYIGNNAPCYVRKFKLSPKEAVGMIKGVGGIAVIAHPKTLRSKGEERRNVFKALIKDGVQGIEVYHSDHTAKDREEFQAFAEKYNLVVTGGSDCHGFGKKEVLIGKVRIPYELVEKMRALL